MIFIETREDLPQSIDQELVETAAHAALTHQSAPADADLTIVLTDDSQLQELNLEWMGIDSPTDVLSFPSEETDPETGLAYLGDILISLPRAEEQAQAAGHALEAEVQLLVVHGILHLMGHDHAEAEEKQTMWKAQSEILNSLGLGGIQIREA